MQITHELIAETVFSLKFLIAARHGRMLATIGQRVDVDDLLQVVAERAMASCAKCKATSVDEFQHWILTIASNSARLMIRDNCAIGKRSIRREGFAIGAASDADDSTQRSGFQPADLDSDPSAIAEVAEATQAVLAVLDRLPVGQARAVRMRYLEQMGNQDIADKLGVSNDAVRLLVSRGIRRARVLLAETATECQQ